VFSPAKYLRTCVTNLAGLRGVSSRVARDGMDRSAGGDGRDGDLPDLALTAEIESKSKSKIRQFFQGLIQCKCTPALSPRGESSGTCGVRRGSALPRARDSVSPMGWTQRPVAPNTNNSPRNAQPRSEELFDFDLKPGLRERRVSRSAQPIPRRCPVLPLPMPGRTGVRTAWGEGWGEGLLDQCRPGA
jgi:hypothetical protein